MTVLFVDDDKDLLETYVLTMSKTGSRLLTATSGQTALELFKDHQDQIELVVTDADMPNGNGIWLAERIQEIKTVPILLITGTRQRCEGKIRKNLFSEILEKPLSLQELQRAIKKYLNL